MSLMQKTPLCLGCLTRLFHAVNGRSSKKRVGCQGQRNLWRSMVLSCAPAYGDPSKGLSRHDQSRISKTGRHSGVQPNPNRSKGASAIRAATSVPS